MKDFKESLVLGLIQLGLITALAVALAITAIAQMLPWIILAGALGICLIMGTATVCRIAIYRTRQERLPGSRVSPAGLVIEQRPRGLLGRGVRKLLGRG